MLQKFRDTQLVTQTHELVCDDVEGHIVTQLCTGGSLGGRVRSKGPLLPEQAAKYVRTLAEFAVACHAKGMCLLQLCALIQKDFLEQTRF